MPILPSELEWRLSVASGPGGSAAQPDPNLSLGGFASSTQLASATLHNLFDRITGEENVASDAEYRCLLLHNADTALTLTAPRVWVSGQTTGGASGAIGVDPTAASPLASASAQALSVAGEDTAPAGVVFSAPTTKASGLSLGNLGPGQVKAIWVRRTAANTPALAGDGVTVNVEGDTL